MGAADAAAATDAPATAAAPVAAARPARRMSRLRLRTTFLYVRALLGEFRWTLLLLAAVLAWGTVVYRFSPGEFEGGRVSLLDAIYATWMAMLAQPVHSPPGSVHLTILCMIYPIVGVLLIGEGVVRLALLLFSRRHGLKEWMRVMASTYRDHVVLCGVGRLGIRVLEQLVPAGVRVVAIEKDDQSRMVTQARQSGVPVIIGDMKDDQTLAEAGIEHASVVVIATNDDMANLEVALDARRMNPRIRVVMRLFEQSIAQKLSNVFLVDVAFSASTLAAPIVAAMSLGSKVIATTVIAGIPHVTAELQVDAASPMVGKRIDELERGYCCKVLAMTPTGAPTRLPPGPAETIDPGDALVIHTPSVQLATVSAAATGKS